MTRNLLNYLILALWVVVLISCQKDSHIIVEKRDDGTLKSSYWLDPSGKLQGEYLNYYENGIDLFEKANYRDSLLEGIRVIYFRGGIPEVEEQYHAGVLQDTLRIYHQNGKLKFKAYYHQGVLTGLVTSYREDGSKLEEVNFIENLENGPFTEYHPNGEIKWTGSYLNGNNEFGELIEYDSTGVMLKRMSCDSLSRCKTVWSNPD